MIITIFLLLGALRHTTEVRREMKQTNVDCYSKLFLSLLFFLVLSKVHVTAQDHSNIQYQAEAFEKHVQMEWTLSPGTQASGFRIYRSLNDAAYAPIQQVGPFERVFIDWLGEIPSGTTLSYYISRVLAGQEFSSDTLHLSIPEMTDDDWMDMVQKYTLKYFWDFGHPISGMARERNTSGDIVTTGGTGFGIMAMIAGAERGFLSKEQVLQRLVTIVSFLQIADTYKGAFPHWMDGRNGRTIPFSEKDNGADLVETAFLFQGLLVAKAYFDGDNLLESSLRQAIQSLYERIEWNWFRRGNQNVLYWHWSPNFGWDMNLPIRGFDEAKMVYLLAIASPTHSIPSELYHAGWAGGNYVNTGIHFGFPIFVGPFAGGPMFFAHYSYIGFDPRNIRDAYCNYFERNRNHALIQQAYARANPLGHPGYSDENWGITASDNPWGYLAHDLTAGRDNGTIAPTAALSSMPYVPEASLLALKHFYRVHGDRLWGPFGFYDAFNLRANWFATSYLAIDQGPIVCMIENHRTGLLWKLFMKTTGIYEALEKIGFVSDLTQTKEEDQKKSIEVKIFPQPLQGRDLYWQSETQLQLNQWRLYDFSGKHITSHKEQASFESTGKLILPNLPSGMYWIHFEFQTGLKCIKALIIP